MELENAEDDEQNPAERSQLHDVVVHTAKTIFARYIAENAPQQINISADTYKRLREAGEHYSRKMFVEAVSEVKLMLNTDILPRFQKTSSYSAMSETLYRDSAGGGDSSSELSDETVSTAGSILTDEEGEEGGVGRIFAKTFKGLHTAFDVGHDGSSSVSASSSRRGNTEEIGAEPMTPTEEKGTSSKEEQSVKTGDEQVKEEPPKPTESEEKKEEREEEDDKKSVEPESSSSNSVSSDSLTDSSSSYDSSESKSDVSV